MTYWFRATPFFAWYDFWVGAYWDRKESVLYVLPLPMCGLKVEFYKRPDDSDPGQPIAVDFQKVVPAT